MHEIQITRAGRRLSPDRAAELIVSGHRVTVEAVNGPHSAPSGIWAHVVAVNGTDAVDRALVRFADFPRLGSEEAAVVADVAAAASGVAAAADRLMAQREAAGA